MQVQLTDTAINAAARRAAESHTRIELADAGLPGLRLRITPAGKRSWVLGMRDRDGRIRRFPLGDFPELGIARARERARQTRHAVKHEGGPTRSPRGASAAPWPAQRPAARAPSGQCWMPTART